jgi:ferredoxin
VKRERKERERERKRERERERVNAVKSAIRNCPPF